MGREEFRGVKVKSVGHIRSEYPGCVGVQAKNEEVPQGVKGVRVRKRFLSKYPGVLTQ